jgi:hypothetical protein
VGSRSIRGVRGGIRIIGGGQRGNKLRTDLHTNRTLHRAPALRLVRFSSPKACSRPNWRRKRRFQSTGDKSTGRWVRESLGSLFGLTADLGFPRLALIE